jgi:hypothetical protein
MSGVKTVAFSRLEPPTVRFDPIALLPGPLHLRAIAVGQAVTWSENRHGRLREPCDGLQENRGGSEHRSPRERRNEIATNWVK